MRTVDIIQKKRDGTALTAAEIRYLIEGFVRGEIPDYQMSAWAMAVYFNGMTAEETAALTMEMARSGEMLDLGAIRGTIVDKHSTGGVGDTTTLVLVPLVAAAGIPVAKMSGRGLGHTGGTIDKLESIPGFAVELTRDVFIEQVNRIGVALTGQTGNITPADKQLYALRDVTATVNSIPLIASSIMSKKIASGADAIVLDVKTGRGAFMKTLEDSIALAEAMVNIGTEVGRETVAVISDMDQPLGYAIGNALEVKEALECLNGGGPADLRALCLELGAYMLVAGGLANQPSEAKEQLASLIEDGAAIRKLREFIEAQGGDGEVVSNPELLPYAEKTMPLLAAQDGYVTGLEAEAIGVCAMMLGAGRETKDAAIDAAAGIILHIKRGDRVHKGEQLATLHYNRRVEDRVEAVIQKLQDAYTIENQQPADRPLIQAVVTRKGVQRSL